MSTQFSDAIQQRWVNSCAAAIDQQDFVGIAQKRSSELNPAILYIGTGSSS